MPQRALSDGVRQLFSSTASAGRLEWAHGWLETCARSGALVLGTTRRAADDFVRAWAERRGHSVGVHTSQLGHLARSLAAEVLAERSETPMSGLGRRALAARATFAVARTRGLTYWEPIHRTPGFPKALARTLLDLRLAGLGAEELARSDGVVPPDLEALLASYELVLSSSELTDEAGVYAAASSAASRGARPPLGLPLLLLDVVPDHLLEERLLRAVIARAPAVAATIHAHDPHGSALLQALLGPAAQVVESEEAAGHTLSRIRRTLFQSAAPEPASADDRFTLFSAASEAEECVEITRRILWLAEKGHRFDRMAVLLRDVEAYGPFLRDAMRRAGVPAFFTDDTKRPDPAGRALLCLLECASEGFSATRFAEYLSLGQAPAGSEPGAAPPKRQVAWVAPRDPSQLVFETVVLPEPRPSAQDETEPEPSAPLYWERLLVDASVVGQRPRWGRRLRGLEEELLLQQRELDAQSPRHREISQRLEGLRRLQAFALPLIEFLASLPPQATWGGWLDFMEELASMAIREPEAVLATLAELRPMAKVGPVSLDEVKEVLRAELSFHRPISEARERRFSRVFVGSTSEASGRSFEHVFVPGLAEGSYPRKAVEDPLLLDEVRERLDPRLETQAERTRRERLSLQLAVSAADQTLVASFPRLDRTQGRARVPSFYALDLIRAAEGALPDLQTLEARALAGAEARIGWPAPVAPDRSIDETEHDLAVLAALFERPRGESWGGARYLLETNPHLGRSLRAQGRRWLPAWRSVDGLVDPDPVTLAFVEDHRTTRRSYSASSLEQYAACPYRFFLHAVHRLRTRSTQTRIEEMDPLTQNSIVREVQMRFLNRQTPSNEAEVEVSLDARLAAIDRTLEEVSSQHEERLAPAIPRVWQRGIERIRTDLRGWIRDLNAAGRPLRWQLDFGTLSEPVALQGGHLVHGSIDLVESEPQSGAQWAVHLENLNPPLANLRTIGRGEALRPVIEALALEVIVKETVGGGRLLYATQRGAYCRLSVPLTEGARKAMARALDTIDQALKQGFLPQAPRRGACGQCEYRLVCGPHEEARVARKDRTRLAGLSRLRQQD